MRAAHRNHAVCGCGRTLSFSDNEHAYLAAMEVGKLLVRDGSATVDALARWASKLADATLGGACRCGCYGSVWADVRRSGAADRRSRGGGQFRPRYDARERTRDDEGSAGRAGRAGGRSAAGSVVAVDEHGAEFLGDAVVESGCWGKQAHRGFPGSAIRIVRVRPIGDTRLDPDNG